LEIVVVTGASGLLGRKLVEVLAKGYNVIPTHNTEPSHPNSLRMDVVDREQVIGVFNRSSPDVVIHAAAETGVDKCETNKEWAWRTNVIGTKNVAEACAKTGAKLVYMSTDYVFDGRKGLYREEDAVNPINYYGLTKLRGEEHVEKLESYVIARTSVLYGWHPKKLNFATWVIDGLRKGHAINVAEDHYNSPTLADDLAEMIGKIIEMGARGIYHTAGNDRISRYEFALEIAGTFGLDRSLITPVGMADLKMWIAERPRDSSLCIDKTQKRGIQPSGLARALEVMKNQH
jgi:dTDP-4-dehydrorhamnose reductase